MPNQYTYLITCPPFCEDLIEEDCNQLGITNYNRGPGFITGTTEYSSLLKIIFYSRIAGRVYLHLKSFEASDFDELYEGALNFDWDKHMSVDQSFSVSVQSKRTEKTDNRYALQRIKDAICDFFRSKTKQRPSVEAENPDTPFYVFWNDREAHLYYDLSGQSLHRRGYREQSGKADLKENLAAAIVRRSGWLNSWQEHILADPFCGSGTLIIEAILLALNIPPGPMRKYYGFFGWKHHDQAVWDQLLGESESARNSLVEKKLPLIWASDKDAQAIKLAKQNAQRAEIESYIHFHRIDFFQFDVKSQISGAGYLVTNPPYGQRLENQEEMFSFYHLMGRQLKISWENWKVRILAPKELSRATGLKALKSHRFNNGNIPCQVASMNIDDTNHFNPFPPAEVVPKKRSQAFVDTNQDMLVNRLKKNQRLLKSWLKKENISCYRLYDADIPEYNGAIDIYENKWIVIQEYKAPREIPLEKTTTRLKTMVQAVEAATGSFSNYMYIKQRSPQKGNKQYRAQSHLGVFHRIQESGLDFLVNFEDYLDTGIFLDHRSVRCLVKEKSSGKKILNLFSYTGTVSCYALSGGAEKVVNVDASRNYLNWAEANLELNGFKESSFENLCGDCFEILKENREQYDLVFCDPPTFSNSKSRHGSFDIQRDYPGLLRLVKKTLAPGGEVIFSCNFRDFKLNPDEVPFHSIEDLTQKTLPEDFKKNPKIHQVWLFK